MKHSILISGTALFAFMCMFGNGCSVPVGPLPVPQTPYGLTITPAHPSVFPHTWTPTITPTGVWNTPTPTVTPYWTPYKSPSTTGIYLDGDIITTTSDGTMATCFLKLLVNNAKETTANIFLTTPSGNVPLIIDVNSYSDFAHYIASTTFPYVPGGTYTLTAVTSIGTATATLEAPGGGVSVSLDGAKLFWDYDGNRDFYWVLIKSPIQTGLGIYYSGQWTSDLLSPATVPFEAYPIYGDYEIQMHPQSTLFTVAGADSSSTFTIQQVVIFNVTYSP